MKDVIMREAIPDHLIGQIFKLSLEIRLITKDKIALPIIIKNQLGVNRYKVLLDMGKKHYVGSEKMYLELKGKVDIEYLKYGGEVQIIPITEEPGYYIMEVLSFYKLNQREYKRVPYRRTIKIIEPELREAMLVNISASGAMIHTTDEIDSNQLTMALTLLKKEMLLKADIIEQGYKESKECYYVRCKFNEIDNNSQKLIIQAVREITLRAKKRLRAK